MTKLGNCVLVERVAHVGLACARTSLIQRLRREAVEELAEIGEVELAKPENASKAGFRLWQVTAIGSPAIHNHPDVTILLLDEKHTDDLLDLQVPPKILRRSNSLRKDIRAEGSLTSTGSQ